MDETIQKLVHKIIWKFYLSPYNKSGSNWRLKQCQGFTTWAKNLDITTKGIKLNSFRIFRNVENEQKIEIKDKHDVWNNSLLRALDKKELGGNYNLNEARMSIW